MVLFRVPALVCINKADVNVKRTAAIERYCVERGIEVAGRLPFDSVVTEAMVQGQPVTAFQPAGVMATKLWSLWKRIRQKLINGHQVMEVNNVDRASDR